VIPDDGDDDSDCYTVIDAPGFERCCSAGSAGFALLDDAGNELMDGDGMPIMLTLECNSDVDHDGTSDTADNCFVAFDDDICESLPGCDIANESQSDNDGDLRGDACDDDDDNDGIRDEVDRCEFDAGPSDSWACEFGWFGGYVCDARQAVDECVGGEWECAAVLAPFQEESPLNPTSCFNESGTLEPWVYQTCASHGCPTGCDFSGCDL
jgi:hypothetical protein